MNRERIQKLIELLKTPPADFRFNMGNWLSAAENKEENWCGTAGCIAGLALVTFAPAEAKSMIEGTGPSRSSCESMAALLLDLDEDIVEELFLPSWIELELITADMAAEALQNLLDGHDDPWEVIIQRIEDAELKEAYGQSGEETTLI